MPTIPPDTSVRQRRFAALMNNEQAPELRELIRVLADPRRATLERLGSLRSLMLSLEEIETTLVSTARAEGATWDEMGLQCGA